MILLSKECKQVFDELKARPQTMADLELSTKLQPRQIAKLLSHLKKEKLIEHNNNYFLLSDFGIKQSNP